MTNTVPFELALYNPEQVERIKATFKRFMINDDGSYFHLKNPNGETYYIGHSSPEYHQFWGIKTRFNIACDVHDRRKTIISEYALRYTEFCKLNADSRRANKRVSEQFKELVKWKSST